MRHAESPLYVWRAIRQEQEGQASSRLSTPEINITEQKTPSRTPHA